MKKKVVRNIIATISAFLGTALGQNVTGNLTAADSGAAIAGATVLAFQKAASAKQRPSIYQAQTDSTGRYAMTLPAGVYQFCVQGADLYLDPCLWGGAPISTVTSSPLAVPIRLTKGWRFILRAHDPQQLLRNVETARGEALSASVTGPSGKPLPLPIVYDNGRIRDFGMVVPVNFPLKVSAGARKLTLVDHVGAELSPQGISFQAIPPPAPPSAARGLFPPPDATMIHVYTGSLRSP
jgi:hypothetical protein